MEDWRERRRGWQGRWRRDDGWTYACTAVRSDFITAIANAWDRISYGMVASACAMAGSSILIGSATTFHSWILILKLNPAHISTSFSTLPCHPLLRNDPVPFRHFIGIRGVLLGGWGGLIGPGRFPTFRRRGNPRIRIVFLPLLILLLPLLLLLLLY